ncbi:MAG: response regulator [Ferruginibacter sp.]
MKTILLIESNSNILENFTEYLEIEGYNILTADRGGRGVEMAREFMPDLIICEILMVGIDGYEVLRLLLDSSKTFAIPFIFCTTKCEKTDRLVALELGADDYMVKPISMELLYTKAKRWISTGSKRHN